MGRGREHAAERSFHHGGRQSRIKKRGHPVSFRRRSFGADHGDLVWGAGFSGTALWTLRSLQYLWGIAVSRCNVCSGRLCGSCRDHDFKPFCQRRKTIQIPTRICKPETEIGHLDSDRKRGFRPRKREGNGKNHRDHNRKNCGFWDQRFHEHGGSHGTSSQRGHQTAF